MSAANRHTPWGYSDDARQLAEGIIKYSTPSHGGIWISGRRAVEMPEAIRACGTWIGAVEWFEEDCDAALVYLAWPDEFPARSVAYAVRLARSYGAEHWPSLADYLSSHETGRKAEAIAQQWEREHSGQWELVSFGAGAEGSWVFARRVSGSEEIRAYGPAASRLPDPFTLEQARALGLRIEAATWNDERRQWTFRELEPSL